MKLLVITSEPITANHPRDAIGSDAADDAEVLVIAPALHESALQFWLSNTGEAIAEAQTVQWERSVMRRAMSGRVGHGYAIDGMEMVLGLLPHVRHLA